MIAKAMEMEEWLPLKKIYDLLPTQVNYSLTPYKK